MRSSTLSRCVALLAMCVLSSASAAENLWIEAEHLDGLSGYCWPMGKPEMKKTNGAWGLSGPGWAAEWNQGGESGFLSIATNDDKSTATKKIEIPADGVYHCWVRYGDWREKTERFQIEIVQGGAATTEKYGERAMVEEDNEAKLYWGWSFTWDKRSFPLKKGPAEIRLKSTTLDPEPRQVDVIVLTTDNQYRPRIKDRPRPASWDILETYREGIPHDLEPLARKRPAFELPAAWKTKLFKDKFVYLWNVTSDGPTGDWLTDDPQRVLYPYMLRDESAIKEFQTKFGGKIEVPIFDDPRIAPAFHGVGPVIFMTDPATGEVNANGLRFAKWLDANPDRVWGGMMNYAPDKPLGEKGVAMFQKYRDRYVGSIAGESLGYFYVDGKVMQQATAAATTRRQLAAIFTPLSLEENAKKYRTVYGKDLDANPFADVISCLSVGNIVFAPFCLDWGANTVGYESSAVTATILPMRWAFIRGGARQFDVRSATYRSCNFGDSATIFSNSGSYHTPQAIYDNYYSVYSGAGVTWYKMDIWYQYMAGSSMFYHEQGFDEYWQPGGLTAAGQREVQLSPKGQLVDRFLRTTAKEPDRGSPYTPVAFLVDHAHGWEPSPYWPNSFKNYHNQEDKLRFGIHEKMLEEYFWTAFFPIGPQSEKPITGTSEVVIPGVFGDIFDVIFAYPDVKKWKTIDTYPVVIVAGEIELTKEEGQRLAQYVNKGGTLLVADAHLTGPGVAELPLPAAGAVTEADTYRWMGQPALQSPRFQFRPLTLAAGERPLATTADGQVFCAAADRGEGRIVYLSVPHGLAICREAVPVLPRLIAHLSRGLMPVEVDGDVNWLVSKTANSWLVTLLNPAGQMKPQQGITPTDYRENRSIKIRSHVPFTTARDRLLPDDPLKIDKELVLLEVPAGGVRIIELK